MSPYHSEYGVRLLPNGLSWIPSWERARARMRSRTPSPRGALGFLGRLLAVFGPRAIVRLLQELGLDLQTFGVGGSAIELRHAGIFSGVHLRSRSHGRQTIFKREGRDGRVMISSQLGRTLLARRSLSADQQEAAPDESGSYGELMDVIDRILEPAEEGAQDQGPDGGHPSAGLAFRRSQE